MLSERFEMINGSCRGSVKSPMLFPWCVWTRQELEKISTNETGFEVANYIFTLLMHALFINKSINVLYKIVSQMEDAHF